jgi:hypothetical protein
MLQSKSVRRAGALLFVSGLVAMVAVAISTPSVTGAAASTTYATTVVGTELHSLDPHFQSKLVPNTGGGAYAVYDPGVETPHPPWYLEATLDLPVGAQVTSVAITLTNCSGGSVDFGSYAPAAGSFSLHTHLAIPAGSCPRQTFINAGSPLTTVANGRRYAITWTVTRLRTWSPDPLTFASTFNGATVRYTCTAPCVP